MKKRNCRMTPAEREQHERATKIRKMTDAQLCGMLDRLAAKETGIPESCATCHKSGLPRVCFDQHTGYKCPNFPKERADLP
jgi:hypothetical protein